MVNGPLVSLVISASSPLAPTKLAVSTSPASPVRASCPPIFPNHEVRTAKGIPHSMRVTVNIDLLLTSATITEAFALQKARQPG